MSRPRPAPRRATLLAALSLALLAPLTACGGNADADADADAKTAAEAKSDSSSDLSSVTLAVGATGWKREEALLKLAGLDNTPYNVKWSVFQGGDLQLQAMRGGALDVALSSEIPPVFAAADGKPNFKVFAVQQGTTLQQGATTVGSGADILSGNFLWTATDSVLADAQKRAAAADLVARINKAYAYVRDGHQQEYAEIVADTTKQPVAQALELYEAGEKQHPTKARATGAGAIASEQKVADAFTELGALPGKLDVSAFWTDQADSDVTKALAS